MNSKKDIRKKKHVEKDDLKGYVSPMMSQAIYAILIIGIIVCLIGVYLIIINGVSSSYSFNRFGSGPVTMCGPVAITLGLVCIGISFWLFKMRKKN